MPDADTHIKGHKFALTIPNARIWNAAQVAAVFGRSANWLYAHRNRLEQLGFPSRDRELGGWHSRAIEAWLDRRAGVESNASIEAEMLEAARGNRKTALHS